MNASKRMKNQKNNIMLKILLSFLLLYFGISTVYASSYMILPIDRIYDGDTIFTHMSENRLPSPLNRLSIRIRGIDTPEKGGRAKCEKEAKLAEDARMFLVKIIGSNTTMKVEEFEWDKYGGRITSDVVVKGTNLGQALIDNGYAVKYDGGTKTKNWCE